MRVNVRGWRINERNQESREVRKNQNRKRQNRDFCMHRDIKRWSDRKERYTDEDTDTYAQKWRESREKT